MIKRVQSAVEKFAPLKLAGGWDNVGILVEAPFPNNSKKVLLTIDLTQKVLNEVLEDDIGVIVAYHPLLFSSFKRITLQDEKQKIALICASKGISVFSPHTALDSCVGGINDWLAKGLGGGTTAPIKLNLNPPPGQEGSGEGRLHTLDEGVDLDRLCKRIKTHLNLQFLRRAVSEKDDPKGNLIIKTIAICAGSGSSVLKGVAADLYLTGEMSHHEVLAAVASGSHVVLTEHSNSERGYLQAVLRPTLEALLNCDQDLPKVQVVCSATDADPLVVI